MTLYLGLRPPADEEIIHCPLIETRLLSLSELRAPFLRLKEEDFTHVLFTSQTVVGYFFEVLKDLNIEKKSSWQALAIGKKTAASLSDFGWDGAWTPHQESSEGFVREFRCRDGYIFYPHSAIARLVIRNAFVNLGIKFFNTVLYETHFIIPTALPSLDNVRKIIFTSPSTVDGFLRVWKQLPNDKELIAIGSVTQQYLDNCFLRLNDL